MQALENLAGLGRACRILLVCFTVPLVVLFWPEGLLTSQSERAGFVPCDHEYLNFRGGKFSKSRGAAVDVPYSLSKYDPDPPRFFLTTTAPKTRDIESYAVVRLQALRRPRARAG